MHWTLEDVYALDRDVYDVLIDELKAEEAKLSHSTE